MVVVTVLTKPRKRHRDTAHACDEIIANEGSMILNARSQRRPEPTARPEGL
jgi:hypothetical protein